MSVQYSREQFLDYYKFKDEPELLPPFFHRNYKNYENLLENVKRDVGKGMRVDSAIVKNAHVSKWTVKSWRSAVLKELREGKQDTPLIRLYVHAGIGDANLESKVNEIAMDLMEQGDSSMVQFFMKSRLGYKTTAKKEVEVAAKDDFNFNINLTDSKKEG